MYIASISCFWLQLVGMGLASIRPEEYELARKQRSGEADGRKAHPY